MAEFSASRPVPLGADHDVSKFDCGKGPLTEFLRKHALANQSGGSAKTFVTTDPSGRVLGYYSLTASAVLHEEAPERVKKGQPMHPIPAILMARFAIDLTAQEKGLGRRLFRDALLRSLGVTEELGVRAFVVDAKDEDAANFYQKFDMMFLPDNTNKLFLLFKDVKKILA